MSSFSLPDKATAQAAAAAERGDLRELSRISAALGARSKRNDKAGNPGALKLADGTTARTPAARQRGWHDHWTRQCSGVEMSMGCSHETSVKM